MLPDRLFRGPVRASESDPESIQLPGLPGHPRYSDPLYYPRGVHPAGHQVFRERPLLRSALLPHGLPGKREAPLGSSPAPTGREGAANAEKANNANRTNNTTHASLHFPYKKPRRTLPAWPEVTSGALFFLLFFAAAAPGKMSAEARRIPPPSPRGKPGDGGYTAERTDLSRSRP